MLDGQQEASAALRIHLRLLEQERQRLGRQIESVKTTLRKQETGEQLMTQEAFDGFDHTRYEDEVAERWGRQAYEQGDQWWRSLSAAEQQSFQQQQLEIAKAYAQANQAGASADSDQVQAITRRHHGWLSITTHPTRGSFVGLGQMYVEDPRFAANYDRYVPGTALLVRGAMAAYAERHLGE